VIDGILVSENNSLESGRVSLSEPFGQAINPFIAAYVHVPPYPEKFDVSKSTKFDKSSSRSERERPVCFRGTFGCDNFNSVGAVCKNKGTSKTTLFVRVAKFVKANQERQELTEIIRIKAP
jgi:hypothetical protein